MSPPRPKLTRCFFKNATFRKANFYGSEGFVLGCRNERKEHTHRDEFFRP